MGLPAVGLYAGAGAGGTRRSALPIMDDLTIEPDAAERLASAAPVIGEPCDSLLESLEASAPVGSGGLPSRRPGSIGIRYRLKRRFRTYDAIACVPTYLAQTRGLDTIAASDGTRIHEGRIYRPLLVGGLPVEATNAHLEAIIRAVVPDQVLIADHPASAEHALLAAIAPLLERYLLIDDEVWISL